MTTTMISSIAMIASGVALLASIVRMRFLRKSGKPYVGQFALLIALLGAVNVVANEGSRHLVAGHPVPMFIALAFIAAYFVGEI